MKKTEKSLLITEDRIFAENIKSVLAQHDIHVLFITSNPAGSILNVYTGSYPAYSIEIIVNEKDYNRAIEIIENME